MGNNRCQWLRHTICGALEGEGPAREDDLWISASRGERILLPISPVKPVLEEDVRVDASPEALAWAVTRGGAVRRDTVARDPSISTTELRRKVGVAEDIPLDRGGFESRAIAPFLEMGAYETL